MCVCVCVCVRVAVCVCAGRLVLTWAATGVSFGGTQVTVVPEARVFTVVPFLLEPVYEPRNLNSDFF